MCSQEVLEFMIERSIIIDHYAYVQDKNSGTDVGIVRAAWNNLIIVLHYCPIIKIQLLLRLIV